ncbi:ParA family protein, partial [Bacillus subtilis]|uniref:ParA family protein n=1 Tax=Bacillus subtilis TaxID=1423 RepID=UPI003980867F
MGLLRGERRIPGSFRRAGDAHSLGEGNVVVVHVLSVSSLKGGVGKTTVTLGLASAAFARGIRTLVVDLDPQSD